MKTTNYLLALMIAMTSVGLASQGAAGTPTAVSAVTSPQDYTVAVYYWPNFHRDAYHQSKKGEGWTEWEIVKNGKPKFEGHYQPKVPLWGYRDESDPKEMARSIDAMADAGIGVIIFDWYRYDDDIHGGVMIEKALKQGFLQATNRDRVKFALMWANHTYIDCHPFAPGTSFNNAPVCARARSVEPPSSVTRKMLSSPTSGSRITGRLTAGPISRSTIWKPW